MKNYYLHLIGCVYAITAYGTSKRDAVARFKKQHHLTRMPKGYSIWSAT
jgi:hypothetical protein